jgi:hypothetical protein
MITAAITIAQSGTCSHFQLIRRLTDPLAVRSGYEVVMKSAAWPIRNSPNRNPGAPHAP